MSRAVILLALSLAACGEAAPRASEGALNETSPGPTVPVLEHPRLALLPAESAAVLRASRLPMLLPSDPALLERAIVTAGPRFAALSAQGEGFSVSIAGTDARHELAEELPPPEPRDQVRGRPATFTVNDGIRTASWDEASVAWALDVECFEVESDARCASDDYLRELAEGLALVGGGP